MKTTKSKILLIKLVVLCVMTFGLFYAKPTQVDAASMCRTCHNNCAAEYNGCMASWFTNWTLCEIERTQCSNQCNDVVCEIPCIAPTKSDV